MSVTLSSRLCAILAVAVLSSGAATWALPVVAGNTNVALAANGGRLIGFSSESVDEHGQPIPEWRATNLIDGKHVVGSYVPADSYGWSSNRPPTDAEPEWVVIGFTDPDSGQPLTRLISRIVIDPTTDSPPEIGRWIRGFTLQATNEDPATGPWRTVGRFLVVNRPVKQTFDFPPTEARYVRLLITSNHGSDRFVELGEVEVYEAIVPGEQINELIVRLETLLDDLKRFRDGQLYQQRQRQPEPAVAPPAETSVAPAEPAPPAAPEAPPVAATRTVDLGLLSLAVPADWEPLGENGETDGLHLLAPGPDEERLALALTLRPLPQGTTLEDFAAQVASQWPQGEVQKQEPVRRSELNASHQGVRSGSQVYLSYCLFHAGQGVVLTVAAPQGREQQAQEILAAVFESLSLRPAE